MVGNITFLMIFAVFDPSPLTLDKLQFSVLICCIVRYVDLLAELRCHSGSRFTFAHAPSSCEYAYAYSDERESGLNVIGGTRHSERHGTASLAVMVSRCLEGALGQGRRPADGRRCRALSEFLRAVD